MGSDAHGRLAASRSQCVIKLTGLKEGQGGDAPLRLFVLLCSPVRY